MNNFFQVNQNSYFFNYPDLLERSDLRGFTAADEAFVQGQNPADFEEKKVLIIGDDFGALSLAYHKSQLTVLLDSELSKVSIEENALENNVSFNSITFANPLEADLGVFDLILIKCPKSMDYLEHILSRLEACSSSETLLAISCMIKHMPNGYFELLYKYFDEVNSEPIRKKARLSYLKGFKKNTPNFSFLSEAELRGNSYEFYKSVFSAKKVDRGTEFLLDYLPHFEASDRIADLGCGYGLIGLEIQKAYKSEMFYVDDSYVAVQSAALSCAKNGIENASFVHSHDMDSIENKSLDWIVSNPPFHLDHVVTENVAKALFHVAKRKLTENGKLLIVLNRHLSYKTFLKGIFASVEQISETQKFKIIEAQH